MRPQPLIAVTVVEASSRWCLPAPTGRQEARGVSSARKVARPHLRKMRVLLKKVSHLGFMPTPSAMKPFRKELGRYETGKGSIRFPYHKPLPKALIRRIAALRVKRLTENDAEWM